MGVITKRFIGVSLVSLNLDFCSTLKVGCTTDYDES